MTWSGLVQRWRRWRFGLRGVCVDRSCFIGSAVSLGARPRVHAPSAISLGPECEISHGTEINPWGGHIRIGRHVFLGPYTVIYGQGGVEIGDSCLIAMHCRILSSNHAIPPMGVEVRSQPDLLLPTKIGRDVWLGAGVTVLGGVTIGDGCIVGAGAVVTKDLPPGSISHGIPAVVKGWRDGAKHS